MRAFTFWWGLFILYCLEVGLVLCFFPWGAGWDRYAIQLPYTGVGQLVLSPWTRAAISGFGVLHLGWAAHDLHLALTGALRRAAR
ncbi:MAG: hypothetical protein ACRD2Z_17725 [Thermoanaerobaculia bacterium]